MRKFESNSPNAVLTNCDNFGWKQQFDMGKQSDKNVETYNVETYKNEDHIGRQQWKTTNKNWK